ncbi:hypothetical protein AKO1_008577, partial [Acrasis kona]
MVYLREDHKEVDSQKLHQFITQNPLGIITTAIASQEYPKIQSTHIPWVLDAKDDSNCYIRGHMARQNPHAKALILEASKNPGGKLEEEVVVLFQSPVNHYITPKFYTETKPSTGKVVPTWNYKTVEVRGFATVFYNSKDQKAKDFLSQQVEELSNQSESLIMGHNGEDGPEPWLVSDAPRNYIDILLKSIIGIEIKVTSIG